MAGKGRVRAQARGRESRLTSPVVVMRGGDAEDGRGARKTVLVAEVDAATWPQRRGSMLRSWFGRRRRWVGVDVAVNNVSWLGHNLRVHIRLVSTFTALGVETIMRLGRSVCTRRCRVKQSRWYMVWYTTGTGTESGKQQSRPATAITGVVGRRMDEGSARQQANHGRV